MISSLRPPVLLERGRTGPGEGGRHRLDTSHDRPDTRNGDEPCHLAVAPVVAPPDWPRPIGSPVPGAGPGPRADPDRAPREHPWTPRQSGPAFITGKLNRSTY
jgi:hypothetical protein